MADPSDAAFRAMDILNKLDEQDREMQRAALRDLVQWVREIAEQQAQNSRT